MMVLSLLIFRECHHFSNEKSIRKDYRNSIRFLEQEKKQLHDSDSLKAEEIVIVRQNLASARIASDVLNHNFKRLESLVKLESKTILRDVELKYVYIHDTTYIDRLVMDGELDTSFLNDHYIRIPSKVSKKDEWMSFDATVDKTFKIDSLSMYNKFDAYLGYKKPDKPLKFLRKAEPVLELKSYSPYTKIAYVNNIVVEDKKKGKFLTSKPAMFLYGIGTGFILSKNIKK